MHFAEFRAERSISLAQPNSLAHRKFQNMLTEEIDGDDPLLFCGDAGETRGSFGGGRLGKDRPLKVREYGWLTLLFFSQPARSEARYRNITIIPSDFMDSHGFLKKRDINWKMR